MSLVSSIIGIAERVPLPALERGALSAHRVRLAQEFDAHRAAIENIQRGVDGEAAALWMRRWRRFFLATAGLFGYADGSESRVSHFRMKAA